MKKFFIQISFLILFTTFLYSDELPEYLPFVKDHPASMIIPAHYLELNFLYGKINDTLDVLNLKQQELKNINRVGDIGDYTEKGGIVNFSLTDNFMITGILKKRGVDYGTGTLDIKTYGLTFRKSFNSVFAIDIGFIKNKGDDLNFTDINELNYYAKKFDPRISIEYTPKFIIFKKKEGGRVEELGVPRKEDLYVSIEDMKDYTKFFRFIIGKTYDLVYPNIFFEYGRTKVTTKIDSNLKVLIPDRFKNLVPDLPVILDRHEKYYKIGFSSFFKTPFRTLTYIEYFYQKLKRDSYLDYVDYNQVFKAEINYFIRGNIIISAGGVYLHRQFNGEIPFMYNKYSQTTFDHRYGWLQFGVTYVW